LGSSIRSTKNNKRQTKNNSFMLKVYGIPNCNTVKKALDWLKAEKIAFEFHDFKKEGVTKTLLSNWSKQVGTEVLINKRGTTWRTFSPEQQAAAATKAGAISLMMEKPSVIKRPIMERNGTVLSVGFDPGEWAQKIKG
jgi:Spx/MgsR family transcriptional regulator